MQHRTIAQEYFDLRMVIRQYFIHVDSPLEEGQTFKEWCDRKKYLRRIIENTCDLNLPKSK